MRNPDPIIGTWKLNIANSKLPPKLLSFLQQTAPKEETVVIRKAGDQLEIEITGIRKDGSPILNRHTRPQKGGILKSHPPLPEGLLLVTTMVKPGEAFMTILQNDKQVAVYHALVSKDGKTLQEKITGTDAEGKTFEGLTFYERQ
jgi:hypothetical protein